MTRKKIRELVESDTKPATFRRANGKTYCLFSPAGYIYHSATGTFSSLFPKRQVEVEIEQEEDGSVAAYVIGNPENIDPEEEVEVLWEAESMPKEPDWDDLDIPY